MIAFDPSAENRWLFAFAHPDDELGLTSWISQLRALGVQVEIVWAHQTPSRKQEALRSAELLGVKESCLTFLDFEDGSFSSDLVRLARTIKVIVGQKEPDRLVFAAFEQGHIDHDALNFACQFASQGVKLEFPEYWPYTPKIKRINQFSTQCSFELLKVSPAEHDLKFQVADVYASQGIRKKVKLYELVQSLKCETQLISWHERLRVAEVPNFSVPAHGPQLSDRIQRHRWWRKWMTDLQRAQAILEWP